METQRYDQLEVSSVKYFADSHWCKSEDVEKLEQLNAEMLCLLMNHEQHKEESWIADYESIIEKNEAIK